MLKVKRFDNKGNFENELLKLTSKIDNDSLTDSQNNTINNNELISNYHYYEYKDNKGNYKDLSIATIEDNKNSIYYIIYINKAWHHSTLFYQLENIDYIKIFNFENEFYNVNYSNKILNYKTFEVDHALRFDNNINNKYIALENIQTLKNMCIEENKRTA